jgi:iron transport multicopper oxidase
MYSQINISIHATNKMLNYITFFLVAQAITVVADTVTLNWDVDWVSVAPDGIVRPAVGVNGQWPCPPVYVNIGDRVLLNVNNYLRNETTAIHFHGIFQTGSSQMDGPAFVNQCPIPPGGCESPQLLFNRILIL